MTGHHQWPPPPRAVATTGPGGVRFRSRLEARWAQFFALCGWPWGYEPELGLDGWFPDFVLIPGGLLVEVKPALSYEELIPHRERILQSGTDRPVWLVGATLALAGPTIQHCLGMRGDLACEIHWWPAQWPDVLRALNMTKPKDFRTAQLLWIQAGNELQWRKR